MEKNNIEKAICCGFGWTNKKLAKLSNDYIIQSYIKNLKINHFAVLILYGEMKVMRLRSFEMGIKGWRTSS